MSQMGKDEKRIVKRISETILFDAKSDKKVAVIRDKRVLGSFDTVVDAYKFADKNKDKGCATFYTIEFDRRKCPILI